MAALGLCTLGHSWLRVGLKKRLPDCPSDSTHLVCVGAGELGVLLPLRSSSLKCLEAEASLSLTDYKEISSSQDEP